MTAYELYAVYGFVYPLRIMCVRNEGRTCVGYGEVPKTLGMQSMRVGAFHQFVTTTKQKHSLRTSWCETPFHQQRQDEGSVKLIEI